MESTPLERIRRAFTDQYTIDRELGRGGMSTVYLAQDAKHERLVALKVLHPDPSWIEHDSDLDAIRGSPRYKALVQAM